MKERIERTLVLVAVLALGAFTGCDKISNSDNHANIEDTSIEDSDTQLEGTIQSEEINLELETTYYFETSQTGVVSDIILSDDDDSVNVETPTTTQVATIAETAPITTTFTVAEGFDMPVDGSVASSNIAVQSISLSKTETTIAVGEKDMPIVSMSPSNASDKSEVWESSNTQVATVDYLGNITGVSEGTCVVTVTSKSNPSVSAEISVTVTPKVETETNDDDTSNYGDEVTEPTYIEGVLIANKTYALPKDYNPYGGDISPEAKEAFNQMQQDALAEGLNLYISSGYRSYEYQVSLYQRYADADGYDQADIYSARPGYSEHQTGLCIDLNTIDDSFANTAEGKWVAENCYKYGFIVRYPKGKESVTGYQYEPWHLRYLGEFLATDVYNSGLCLEEYLGITSEYAN